MSVWTANILKIKKHFFPQVNDLLEPDVDGKEETVDITHLGRNNAKQYPKKLLGYEALLDDNLDLDMAQPVGKWWLYYTVMVR